MTRSRYYVDRIQRAVDFIEAHLDDEDLSRVAVAGAAGFSPWHFERIFKSLAKETLAAYVRSRRLARALERLATTELRVLDIAVLAGFDSQESFARAFKKAFGMTPRAYRRIGQANLFPKKLQLDEATIHHLTSQVSLEPELYPQPRMTLVGLRTTFYGAESEKNNIGEKLPPLWEEFLARRRQIEGAHQEICYGYVIPERDDDARLVYLAAVEVAEPGEPPPGMTSVEVHPATYARFQHRGEAASIDRTVSYAYSTWLLSSGRRHTGGPDLEIYDHRWHPTSPESVFFYALPVESLP